MHWHSLTAKQTLENLNVNVSSGLSSEEVRRRQEEHGLNTLTEKKQKSIFLLFLEQFKDFMVIILLIAAAISFFISFLNNDTDWLDPIIILLIVIVNAIIGVVQELKAEKAIDALKKMTSPESRVRRNGKEVKIPSSQIVVGDIIILKAGDLVPADARLIEGYNLKTEESALTGESLPVEKKADVTLPEKTILGDQKNILFSTSVITFGRGVAVVVETGMSSQVGKIAKMINEEENPDTPLQIRLAKVGKLLGIAALIICFLIFIMGTLQNIPALEMFMISVSLAVAAIPEGLPAIVTIVLAVGVQRLAKCKSIIRKLPAVETLGSATVICSDKTGTLTQNKMTVVEISDGNNSLDFSSELSHKILELSCLCNNSILSNINSTPCAEGDPTETALVIAGAKNNKNKNQLDSNFPRINEIPFDSKRKLMTTVHRLTSGGYRIITKGAPDVLINLCSYSFSNNRKQPIDASKLHNIKQGNTKLAEKALRVIAVAYKDVTSLPSNLSNIENDLIFCGLIGMIDPPRPEVKSAVKTCKRAGIKPVMITGDHVVTAKAIAKDLGILTKGSLAITGKELDNLSQQDLIKNINNYSVFARVSPEHKVRVVKAFQAKGHVVAMTGDGVNDAPALKAADIGCAMGITGTEVTKGAADMILVDDNFATIVHAIKEGRGIYDNIRKAIHFLLSSNIGEIITIFIAFLLKLPTPLLAVQLLWVNLVTDSLPALALGAEKPDKDIMQRKPIHKNQSLFSGGMGFDILFEGAMVGALALLAFVIGNSFFDCAGEPICARTMAFAVLSLSQLVHAFNVRSEESIFKVGIFSNKQMVISCIICCLLEVAVITITPIAAIFKTVPLSLAQWLIVIALTLIPLVTMEIAKSIKHIFRRRLKKDYSL